MSNPLTREQQGLLNTFSKELANDNAALFVGAGLSVPAGFVNWKQLLRAIAAEIDLDVELEHDLVAVAQFHFNERQSRSALNRALMESFSKGHELTENHRIMARLPVKTFWTTNYDTLIEEALRESRRIPDVKHTVSQLKSTVPQRDAVVYKMHGDITLPDDAVLIKDDYERYSETRGAFTTALSGDLIEKCFLFLGFSFSDPNLEYILSRVRLSLYQKPRDHFCIFRKVSRIDYKTEEEFLYAQVRQELATRDLKRFGIQTVFVAEHSDITDILRAIERRHRRRTVLISGSADTYGKHGANQAQRFISDLSKKIISKSYRIASGFGSGVGSFVISGALEEIYQVQGKRLHDQLILRPFPQGTDGKERQENYRKDMVQYAGTAIFIFGNKLEEGTVKDAGGVRREFELACEAGLMLIPVGATGFVAEELWVQVMSNFDKYYPGRPAIRQLLEQLGPDRVLSDVIKTVIKILEALEDR